VERGDVGDFAADHARQIMIEADATATTTCGVPLMLRRSGGVGDLARTGRLRRPVSSSRSPEGGSTSRHATRMRPLPVTAQYAFVT